MVDCWSCAKIFTCPCGSSPNSPYNPEWCELFSRNWASIDPAPSPYGNFIELLEAGIYE